MATSTTTPEVLEQVDDEPIAIVNLVSPDGELYDRISIDREDLETSFSRAHLGERIAEALAFLERSSS